MADEIKKYDSIEDCIIDKFGEAVEIDGKSYVGGGDINEAVCLTLSSGDKVFMKANDVSNRDFFRAEEEGLNAIRSTGAIGTPKMLGQGVDLGRGISFLMMEFIDPTGREADFWENFGRSLAQMHLADTSAFTAGGKFGFTSDNYIGATPQVNSVRDTWIDFFRECRLEPQFKMADRYFDDTVRRYISQLLDKLSEIMIEPKKPSLLHGDLWSGNYMVGNDGKAWLIDPAVYVGCFEADLAMTELFGRFPERFYRSYSEVNKIDESYNERRDLYNLYHIVNHLNLFGSSYYPAVVEMICKYI